MRAGERDVEVVAESTVGYGCVVPPFISIDRTRVSANACASGYGEYFLTTGERANDPVDGPPGRYHLVGRWEEAPTSWSAWARTRGEAASEGAPEDDVELRVFIVSDWCVEERSVPRAYRKPSTLAPASASWRRRVCR